MFGKGFCPICQKETNAFNRTTIKHSDGYICQGCMKILSNDNINAFNVKNYSLEKLQHLIFQINIDISEKMKQKKLQKLEQMQKKELQIHERQVQKGIELQNHVEFQTLKNDSKTIKKTIIVGNTTDSRKKVGSSVMRGMVGGALLGPAGLIGGAVSGKNKTTTQTTFVIEYNDGHRETKTVDNNSKEFHKLCNYLEM